MKQKWKKRVAAILLILGGISLVGYPWISDWCYRVHTQSSVAVYAAEAKEQSDVKAQLMQDAIAYNTWLSEAHITLSDPFFRSPDRGETGASLYLPVSTG